MTTYDGKSGGRIRLALELVILLAKETILETRITLITIALVSVVLATAASPAVAGPKCTAEPQSKWLTEDQMMSKILGMGYKNIKNFHVSKGKCYEIYGYDKENRKVEVYFHPITGEIAESNVE